MTNFKTMEDVVRYYAEERGMDEDVLRDQAECVRQMLQDTIHAPVEQVAQLFEPRKTKFRR